MLHGNRGPAAIFIKEWMTHVALFLSEFLQGSNNHFVLIQQAHLVQILSDLVTQ